MKRLLCVALFFALPVALATGCGPRAGFRTGEIVVLDIEAAIENPKPFDLADIADDISFIPLDGSRPEAMIGTIWNLAESSSRFYIHEGGHPVRLFDRAGKFVATRGTFGRGPDEFLMISNLATDWHGDELYLWGVTPGKKMIRAYDANGAIIARADTAAHPSAAMTEGVFRDGELAMWNHAPGAGQPLLEVFSRDLKRVGEAGISDGGAAPVIYSSGGRYMALPRGFLSGNGHSVVVYETLRDTVFRYNGDATLTGAFVLNQGQYAPPAEVFGENATVAWNTKWVFVNAVWESDRYAIVRVNHHPGNEFLVFERGEIPSGFLAVGSDGAPGIFVGGVAVTPMYVRDNRLVGYMQAIDIVDNAAGISNPALKALADTLKEDSNPVIVVAKIK